MKKNLLYFVSIALLSGACITLYLKNQKLEDALAGEQRTVQLVKHELQEALEQAQKQRMLAEAQHKMAAELLARTQAQLQSKKK